LIFAKLNILLSNYFCTLPSKTSTIPAPPDSTNHPPFPRHTAVGSQRRVDTQRAVPKEGPCRDCKGGRLGHPSLNGTHKHAETPGVGGGDGGRSGCSGGRTAPDGGDTEGSGGVDGHCVHHADADGGRELVQLEALQRPAQISSQQEGSRWRMD